jgi:hypothetical protein
VSLVLAFILEMQCRWCINHHRKQTTLILWLLTKNPKNLSNYSWQLLHCQSPTYLIISFFSTKKPFLLCTFH